MAKPKNSTTPSQDPSWMQRAENSQGYIASSGSVTLGGSTEVPLLLLSNPDGAFALKVFIRRFCNLTSGHFAAFGMYLNPTTPSGGSSKTPVALRPLNAPVAQGTVKLSPSVGGNGTLLGFVNAGNVQAEAEEPLILDPGQSLLITVKGATSDAVQADLCWFES